MALTGCDSFIADNKTTVDSISIATIFLFIFQVLNTSFSFTLRRKNMDNVRYCIIHPWSVSVCVPLRKFDQGCYVLGFRSVKNGSSCIWFFSLHIFRRQIKIFHCIRKSQNHSICVLKKEYKLMVSTYYMYLKCQIHALTLISNICAESWKISRKVWLRALTIKLSYCRFLFFFRSVHKILQTSDATLQ